MYKKLKPRPFTFLVKSVTLDKALAVMLTGDYVSPMREPYLLFMWRETIGVLRYGPEDKALTVYDDFLRLDSSVRFGIVDTQFHDIRIDQIRKFPIRHYPENLDNLVANDYLIEETKLYE